MFGTRTTREMIWGGANMGLFLKWGNWAVAKLVEALDRAGIELIGDGATSMGGGRGVRLKAPPS